MTLRLGPGLDADDGRRRRFLKGDGNQVLDDLPRAREVDVQSAQKRQPDGRLDERGRGERINALARPNRPSRL